MKKITMTHEERKSRREDIANEIRHGNDPHAVAKMFSVTLRTIASACRENKVPMPKVKSERAIRNPKSRDHRLLYTVSRLISSSKSYSELAREIGITRQAVHRTAELCKHNKIKIKERDCG
jgi:DNA invertase Pin-like site-specific DNA recombinase